MIVQANIDPEQTYSLLLLPPELEKALRDDQLSLCSSAEDKSIAVCTDDATFGLRRLNQSNNLFLASQTDSNAVHIFASPNLLLESASCEGKINWSDIPVLSASGKLEQANDLTLESIFENSECSPKEFQKLWRDKGGCIVNGTACIMDGDLIHSAMIELVSAMVESGDTELQLAMDKAVQLTEGYDHPVVESVYQMFSSEKDGLDISKLTRWIGEYLLKQHPDGLYAYELRKQWAQELPVSLKPSIAMLTGCVVEVKPGFLKYVDASRFSDQPKYRFAELFRLKNEWLLDDIAPFLQDMVPVTSKLETWVLKYTKRTKRGAEFYLSPRKL